MLSLHRNLGFATFAAVVMLASAAFAPARAGLGAVDNALTATALVGSSSAFSNLNGIAVEAVTLPQTSEH